jgi:hypothetical protein
MNKIIEIQEKILDTNQAIAEIEKAIASDPFSFSLSAMAKSLTKRYQQLEMAFQTEVSVLGVDICTYRIFGEEKERPTIKSLSSVLGDFQTLVSTVYDAIKSEMPRARARLSADVTSETEFRFGYTFPGSVGVVLTVPNQRLLFGESKLDESLLTISKMARLQESEDVLAYSKKLGPASVRALYRWAYDHAESGLGVDIEWRREQLVRTRLLAQKPELQKLHQTINRTSEQSIHEMTISAELVGVDVLKRNFHMKLSTGEEIKGSLVKELNIGENQTVELPKFYKAHLQKTEVIHYSTEKEDITYHLLGLEPI